MSQIPTWKQLEYAKFWQDKQTTSSEPERTNIQNLTQLTENEMESNVSFLTLRISELESQVVEMQTSLILEKEQMRIAKKNALEKEEATRTAEAIGGQWEKTGSKERKEALQEILKFKVSLYLIFFT